MEIATGRSNVALVTGASRGLGASIARALAGAGWAVAVNYAHDEPAARRVVEAIAGAGGRAIAAHFDVTEPVAVKSGIERIAALLGPVELIVNNATGPQPVMPIAEQSWDVHLAQLHFFVKAPLLLLQAVLTDWRARKVGRVVNVGSEVVELGSAEFGHYVAAKAAMVGLTRSWANELGNEGITVNLVAPGWIPVERHVGVDPADLEGYRRLVALGRIGSPQDIAAAVVFLSSKGADFITGQIITINGGRTLR